MFEIIQGVCSLIKAASVFVVVPRLPCEKKITKFKSSYDLQFPTEYPNVNVLRRRKAEKKS